MSITDLRILVQAIILGAKALVFICKREVNSCLSLIFKGKGSHREERRNASLISHRVDILLTAAAESPRLPRFARNGHAVRNQGSQ